MEDQDIYDTAVVGVIESLPTFPRDESSTLILPRMKAYIVSHLRKEGRKYASIVLGNTDMHVYDIYNMETNLSVADSPAIKAIDASLDVGEVTSKMAQSGELNPEELRLLHEKFVLDKSVRQIALESDYNYDTLWHTFDDIYAKYKNIYKELYDKSY